MKIALLGYGKMGKAIEEIAMNKGHEIVLRIGSHNRKALTTSQLTEADVAIEFSRPESAVENLLACFEAGIPVVSGTTGWLGRLDLVEQKCSSANGAFLYASNFSIGVNIFFEVNRVLAMMMNLHPQYDLSMTEIHHTQKLDAPSGTAITLAEDILQEIERKAAWVNQEAEKEDELSIISKRIDKVPGTHEISYHSAVDSIEIKHTAHSRTGFASGALLAAEWMIGKKGSFRMKDVLGLFTAEDTEGRRS